MGVTYWWLWKAHAEGEGKTQSLLIRFRQNRNNQCLNINENQQGLNITGSINTQHEMKKLTRQVEED